MASCSVLGPRLGWVWASLESSLVVGGSGATFGASTSS